MIIAKCVQLNNNGWDSYEELELDKTYEVDYADVGRYYTSVYLKGFSHPFNSVCFDYYKDGKEIDIVEEYIDLYYQKYKRGGQS